MKTLQERIDHWTLQFSQLPDWEARYKKIIEVGRALPDLPEELKTEESKVRGCQSQVWLHASLDSENRIQFQGDSDALLVKGLVALVLQIYSGSSPSEILATSPDFLAKMGFASHLSPSRANGLMSMIKQILNFAYVFQIKVQSANS